MLKKKKGKFTRLSYLWKNGDEESPLTVEVIRIRKKWDIGKDKIDASYELKLSVEEFPPDSLDKKKTIKELENFFQKK